MPSFSDIELEIQNVLDSAMEADADPETQAAFDEYLADLAGREAEKGDAIAFVLRGMRDKRESLRKLADEILRKARSIERAEDHLRGYVLATMEAAGLQKVKGDTFTLSRRSCQAVRIDDECRIPIEYMQVSAEPMRAEIKAALKAGKNVPGASLVETTSLMVR